MHTFLTLALGGCDGQCAPATLPPQSTAQNMYWTAPELVQEPSRKEISVTAGNQLPRYAACGLSL